jgi:hypothetical protein
MRLDKSSGLRVCDGADDDMKCEHEKRVGSCPMSFTSRTL